VPVLANATTYRATWTRTVVVGGAAEGSADPKAVRTPAPRTSISHGADALPQAAPQQSTIAVT
jgi:hypothetical protein